MFKSVTLPLTLLVFTLGASAAVAASPSTAKVTLKIDGKTRVVTGAQLRVEQAAAYTAYRKAVRAANAFSNGSLPAGCVRFPRFISCSALGYYCAVGRPNTEWRFNCGRSRS